MTEIPTSYTESHAQAAPRGAADQDKLQAWLGELTTPPGPSGAGVHPPGKGRVRTLGRDAPGHKLQVTEFLGPDHFVQTKLNKQTKPWHSISNRNIAPHF